MGWPVPSHFTSGHRRPGSKIKPQVSDGNIGKDPQEASQPMLDYLLKKRFTERQRNAARENERLVLWDSEGLRRFCPCVSNLWRSFWLQECKCMLAVELFKRHNLSLPAAKADAAHQLGVYLQHRDGLKHTADARSLAVKAMLARCQAGSRTRAAGKPSAEKIYRGTIRPGWFGFGCARATCRACPRLVPMLQCVWPLVRPGVAHDQGP